MKITDYCHTLLLPYLKSATCVVDATVGKGLDTKFICENVPPSCQVIGFDIQEQALIQAKELLLSAGLNNFKLLKESHANLRNVLLTENFKSVDLIVFNLGYLPYGDKTITTKSDQTISAIEQGLDLLKENGLISVMVYPGHPEGQKESEDIEDWLVRTGYAKKTFKITNAINKSHYPYLLLIHK